MNSPLFLCISLERTPERWLKFEWRFKKRFGFVPTKLPAVDARLLTSEEILSYLPVDRNQYTCGRELLPSEVGCALSHRLAWQTLADSASEWALVMEDDILFSENRDIDPFVLGTSWIPKHVDIVQIGSYTKNTVQYQSLNIETIDDGFQLGKLFDPISYGTQAYWIRKRVVAKALKLTMPLVAPIDNLMFDVDGVFIHKCHARSLIPFVCYDPELSSTIGADRHSAPTVEAKPSWWRRYKKDWLHRWYKIHAKPVKRFLL